MRYRFTPLIVVFFTASLFTILAAAKGQEAEDKKRQERQQQSRQEESEDYYKKWLEEDVKYIITDQERDIFEKLSNQEERESFVEQFWFRRDPDPRTSANEFKQEHYRRIAFANEKFQSGKPGWMTDRGRVYIIHGEPVYIERYPSGGPYMRKPWEGGGSTYTYPFEVWLYRDIAGIGDDVELEFVDPSFSGEYRLAVRPEEKDMMLYASGTTPTTMELLGRDSGRVDRPYFNPGIENNSAYQAQHGYRAKDTPFARYNRFFVAQKAPEIEFYDLKEMVTANITYQEFPFEMRADFIQLNETQVLVPITIQVENKELTFDYKNGVHIAKANVYGIVTNMIGRIEAEFEDSVVAEYKPDFLEEALLIKSLYQKVMVLDACRLYRLDIVVRDENTNRTGLVQKGLNVPPFKDRDSLQTSSVILSKSIQPAPESREIHERFVLGDVKIIPNVNDIFKSGEWLGTYLQIYNFVLDQSTLEPDIRVRYTLRKGGKVIQESIDTRGDTVQYYSPQRLVLIRQIELKEMEAGTYQIEVEVEDEIGQKSTSAKAVFTVVG
jgi:GWxTD domain-containing protein